MWAFARLHGKLFIFSSIMKTFNLRFSSIDRLFAISIFVSLSTTFLKLKHLLTDYPRLSSSQP